MTVLPVRQLRVGILLLLLSLSSAVLAAPAITNGSMTEGKETPSGWDAQNARIVRDTEDFRAGPASLRVESASGPVEDGKTTQKIRNAAGSTFIISGYVKSTGADVQNAGLAILVQGRDWKQLQWETIAPHATFASTDWTPFRRKVSISPEAGNVLLICYYSGTGKIWLDEVDIALPDDAPAPSPVVIGFGSPFSYLYGDFDRRVTVADGVAHIGARASRGGAGINAEFDLSPFADMVPALRLKLGPNNKSETVKAFFAREGEGKAVFSYRLGDADTDEFRLLLPENGATLRVPNDGWLPGQEPLDLGSVAVFQVQGEWKGEPLDVYIDAVEMTPATPEHRAAEAQLLAALEQKAERQRQQAEQREREKQEALMNARHLPDGPEVVHACAVAPYILAVTIQSQTVTLNPQVPYEAQEGDTIVEKGKDVLAWHHGSVVRTKKDLEVQRADERGRRSAIGLLAINAGVLWPGVGMEGAPIATVTVGEPEAYLVSSRQDAAFRTPVRPVAVHHKSKPTNHGPGNDLPVRHWVYLQLPNPLQEGATYEIAFPGVNTRQEEVTYTHRSDRARSDAVHVSHVGYRPDDPFKRAFLSTWLGTGGRLSYDAEAFEILDAEARRVVYEGSIELAVAADQPERMKEDRNYNQTDVYRMDFAGLDTPGTYVVHVPGIGTSYPFRIADDVWADAFGVSMKGFLHHRSGIALGPPFTDYVRPRCFHPADGMRIFELEATYWDGEAAAVNRELQRRLGTPPDPSAVPAHPQAWGGYMDAGDWDRRSQHLMPTYLHLELLDLFPDYFGEFELALPPDEAANALPDVLDEALWNLDLYRRLQRPDGGVGGGVESTAHPRGGECSWQESLCVGTFSPEPETTLRYAACAAKAARLAAPYDRALGVELRESALRAWRWAEANAAGFLRESPNRARGVAHMRALAGAELARLTGERTYAEAAAESLAFEAPFDQFRHGWFAYALLPDELSDPAVKGEAVEGYRMLGDVALEFASGNAFNITTDVPGLPMIGYVGYWSTPGMTVGPGLPRAHYLTGEQKYLAGTVAACNFSVGANPMNMTMTIGVGHDYPRAPLHIDSRRSGQPAPAGITVYGPSDPRMAGGAYDWAHQWKLGPTMVPDSRSWPASEFYTDIYTWPPMNEYTVHQTFGPTSYHWGYLAARR